MAEWTTLSFSLHPEQKELLEQWAKEDDRSVSYLLRQFIILEKQRRDKLKPGAVIRNLGVPSLFGKF